MCGRVFPARAGMSRYESMYRYQPHCVPRASGDEPVKRGDFAEAPVCSPRERG